MLCGRIKTAYVCVRSSIGSTPAYCINANTPSQNYIWISQNKRTAHILRVHTTLQAHAKTLRLLFCYCCAEYNYCGVVGAMALNKICTSHWTIWKKGEKKNTSWLFELKIKMFIFIWVCMKWYSFGANN